MRILFICSEYEGLIKTGGLADACRGLAQALTASGHQVTVVLPCFAPLYHYHSAHYQSVFFDLAGRGFGCAVHQFSQDGINIALIEHHEFFRRDRPYDDGEHGYSDNPLRFAFFAKAALEWALHSGQQFDLIHGHDWQTALAAVFFSGCLFLLLSIFKIREWIINSIPFALKMGIAAGIGMFLALIALKTANIIVASPATLVTLGDLHTPQVVLALVGFFIIFALAHRGWQSLRP